MLVFRHTVLPYLSILAILSCGSNEHETYDGETEALSEPGSECILIASDSIDIMLRPDSTAAKWSTLPPGDSVNVSGRTESGWLGFDPGVAQAANTGSFRYRWIREGEAFSLRGSIGNVPVVWSPEPGIPYAMIYEDTPIYREPDTLSEQTDSVYAGSAASVISKTENWYLLNLEEGPEPRNGEGWISGQIVSINGDIDSIPEWDAQSPEID